MERIRSYFEKLGKTVIEIDIASEIKRKCPHCGYGKTFTGKVILNPSKRNDFLGYLAPDSDSEDGEELHETFDFVYNTGCLTYDEEMII